MKKFFVISILFVIFISNAASAEIKFNFNQYKCLVCDKIFESFPGDELDRKDFKDKQQLNRIFQFLDRGRNFPECKNGFKTHIFEKKGTTSGSLRDLTNSSRAQRFGVIKDGGSLSGINLTEWECLYCKKHFFSLNKENLNIRDWEQQPNYIYNVKGRPISKCSNSKVYGHIFYPKKTGSVRSYDLAKIIDNLYWVKN
ncbi:MAG: hypothetical protein IJP41_10450 [Synergistaceae bacterium]|nr:hypothetical protein [Synergistaceae bacterium]